MEGRNFVVVRQALALLGSGVAARLQQQHAVAEFGEPGRHRAAPGARADDDVVPGFPQ